LRLLFGISKLLQRSEASLTSSMVRLSIRMRLCLSTKSTVDFRFSNLRLSVYFCDVRLFIFITVFWTGRWGVTDACHSCVLLCGMKTTSGFGFCVASRRSTLDECGVCCESLSSIIFSVSVVMEPFDWSPIWGLSHRPIRRCQSWIVVLIPRSASILHNASVSM